MDCASVITGFFFSSIQNVLDAGFSSLRDLASEWIGNLYNLGKNAEAVVREMRDLGDARDDLSVQVEIQERQPQMRRTQLVIRWFEDVGTLQTDVDAFLVTFQGRTTCLEGCSFESLHTNFGLGRKAADLLRRVGEMRDRRGNLGSELIAEVPLSSVEEVPAPSSTSFIGGEKALSEIEGCLREDAVGIIGIYGMGGIGKTTLLTNFNNNLLKGHIQEFDVVIWVTVSKDPNTLKIQKDIGERVGLSLEADATGSSCQVEEQAKKLFKALAKKKFLLLLDDIWEELDLIKVGIPYPSRENKCKIIFTTRSKYVCTRMDAQKHIKVDFLNKMESWKLFSEKVGTEVDLYNPTIHPLAQTIANKCGGLPLALITVGRAMADAKTVMEWEEAIALLRESPNELLGMEEVLSLLKFSFDRLKDEATKQCLLYCSLFPEDYEIDIVELVECWLGEGFLDRKYSDSIDRARNMGHNIITRLKVSCLLESVNSSIQRVKCVKMHDVVREMALWLTGGEVDERNKFLVYAGKGITQFPTGKRWQDAKRVSLMRSFVTKLPNLNFTCSCLLTLLLPNCEKLKSISQSFFLFTPTLQVLNLSSTGIEELPEEVGSLVDLRYLNLSSTDIISLPKGLGKLIKLKILDLSWTYRLSTVPHESIVMLSRLQSLNLYGSGFSLEEGTSDNSDLVTFADLECSLEELEELGFGIKSLPSLERIVRSDAVSKWTRFLHLRSVPGLTTAFLSSAFERLENLREVFVYLQSSLEELRINRRMWQNLNSLYLDSLEHTRIVEEQGPPSQHWNIGTSLLPPLFPRLQFPSFEICHGFKELTWVGQLPCLEYINLRYCDGIEELLMVDRLGGGEIVESEYDSSSFRMLRQMSLTNLKALRSISGRLLLLPSLERLVISNCPELNKLPLGLDSAKKIKMIVGEQEWWDGLQWEDTNGNGSSIRTSLDPYFTTDFFLPHL